MSLAVFLGPTLQTEQARALLDARFLPPAKRGDVYLAALTMPTAIAVIDGYFDQVPAVWHKEILWALSQGIHVFGAASMGALRAVELQAFGMRGVGRVFRSFADGTLEGDDEVAVAHASAELGYRPMSEAMVNIRATLEAAAREGLVDESHRSKLEELAKATFYPDRTFAGLLASAGDAGMPPSVLSSLRDWLPRGRVDQKREDAIELLRLLSSSSEALSHPCRVDFELAETDAWLGLCQALTGA